ncbi:hypothetical protein HOC13_00010 [Candidatus Woesearchaeota archaeon]|jgi:hypothetical protein|nr:hypothetical protein [Candidatus Woesearchaeota archaeon]
MESCYVCKKKGSFKHLDRSVCKQCFIRNIERRVKRYLGRKLFKKGDKILVVGDLVEHLLKRAIKDLPVKIEKKKRLPKDVKKFKWVVIGKTLDELCENFLLGLFKGELDLRVPAKKFVNILEPITKEELKKYSQIKKVEYKEEKDNEKIGKFFKGLSKHKEIKYNLYKNIKELREKVKRGKSK